MYEHIEVREVHDEVGITAWPSQCLGVTLIWY